MKTTSKTIIRVPLDQYAYIEQEFSKTLSPEEAIGKYNELLKAYKGGSGVSSKDFNTALDGYLRDGRMEADVYAAMDAKQIEIIQTIKRSLNRINYASKVVEAQ